MAGLIETLAAAPYHGRADMPEIARSLHLEVDDLFPVAEVLQHLGFADVREGDIFLTPPARVFAEFGTQERKMMFAEHLLRHVPLAARIKKVLNERPGHRAPRVRFEQELEDFLSRQRRGRNARRGHQLGPLWRDLLVQRPDRNLQSGRRGVLSAFELRV